MKMSLSKTFITLDGNISAETSYIKTERLSTVSLKMTEGSKKYILRLSANRDSMFLDSVLEGDKITEKINLNVSDMEAIIDNIKDAVDGNVSRFSLSMYDDDNHKHCFTICKNDVWIDLIVTSGAKENLYVSVLYDHIDLLFNKFKKSIKGGN